MFPSRDAVVEHLERHAHEDGLELQLDTSVDRIDRIDRNDGPGPQRSMSPRRRWWWRRATSTSL
jgi:hypothetical protein